ncbi:MAG: PrsW family intramembrane metalloprotease [Candidatus Thorarchaeota archaeon]
MDPDLITIIIMSVIPPIGFTYFVYKRDTWKPDSPALVLIGFLFGILSAVMAYFLELYGTLPLGNYLLASSTNPWYVIVYTAFIVAGFSEEFCKLLIFGILIWYRKKFDEIYDGMMYMIAISMGFAAIENIRYGVLYLGPTIGLAIRGITSVPAHSIFSGVMGYWVGKGKTTPGKAGRYVITGLFAGIILHGIYDTPAISISTNFIIWFLVTYGLTGWIIALCAIAVFLIVGYIGLRRLLNKAKEEDASRQ